MAEIVSTRHRMPQQFYISMLMNNNLHYQNVIPAMFHIITITFISMSLVEVPWFVISGGVCTSYLSLSQFFWFGYIAVNSQDDYLCINTRIVNLMRTLILLCFMAIFFSLTGFFLDILAPKPAVYKFIRRYAIASTCTVFWLTAVLSICYYVLALLEESLAMQYPKIETEVAYGYGFYLIVTTIGVVLLGTFCTLILMQTGPQLNDQRCLINAFNGYDSLSPPPPYNIAPPPYRP